MNDGSGGLANGWYGLATVRASMNNMVIYPDEAFIVAKRTSGNVELEVEGTISTETQKLFLPETNDQMLCNNPYGMELFLAELIPPLLLVQETQNSVLELQMMALSIM